MLFNFNEVLMRVADVCVNGEKVGVLSERESGDYSFTYDEGVHPNNIISLTMPLGESYDGWQIVHPVFHVFMPEGAVLDRIRSLAKKTDVDDDFSLLALVGKSLGGRVSVVADGTEGYDPAKILDEMFGEGADGEFSKVFNEAGVGALGLSGAMPKFAGKERAGAATSEVIVKHGGRQYPLLGANEGICLTMARKCGFNVPEIRVSSDGEVFAIKRFDIDEKGGRFGMEDLCSLLGRPRHAKFSGSEKDVVTAIKNVFPIKTRRAALDEMFRRRLFDELVGNGDSHLKNTAVIYSSREDVRLSPMYDVVCTKAYLPKDTPARSIPNEEGVEEKRWLSYEKGDVERLGAIYGIPPKLARKMADDLASLFLGEMSSVLDEAPNDTLRSCLEKVFLEGLARVAPNSQAVKPKTKRKP